MSIRSTCHWDKMIVSCSESKQNILTFENVHSTFTTLDMASTSDASDNQLGLLTDWMNPSDLICKLEIGDLIEINRRFYQVSCNFLKRVSCAIHNILQHWAVCVVCESDKSTLIHVSTTETDNRYS